MIEKKTLRSIPKCLRLIDHICDNVILEAAVDPIIPDEPFIKRINQPSVVLFIQQTCLGEILPIGSNNISVFSKIQTFFIQQGFCYIEHGVISPSCSKIRLVI